MNTPDAHDRDGHDEICLLLPWYVNGTLDPPESARVSAHLLGCRGCRAELAAQRELRAQIKAPPAMEALDANVALGHFMARIRDDFPSVRQASAVTEHASRHGLGALLNWFTLPGQRSLAWAGAAGLLAVAVLPLVYDFRSAGRPNIFHTAANPGSFAKFEANDIRVVFAQPLTAEAIQSIVEPLQGRLVDGPSGPGIYTIRFDVRDPSPDFLAERLDRLRARKDVAFAEPAIPGSDPRR
jgi:hypothetical protein